MLTRGQKIFVRHLSRETGLNPRVVAAWALAEQSGSAAANREAQGNHNWLNVAMFDSGPGALTRSPVWRNPVEAARATANVLRKTGSPSIRAILSARDPNEQLAAIARSNWATSHYQGGAALRQLYREVGGPDVAIPSPTRTPNVLSAPATSSPSFDQAGYDQARKRAVLANLLSQQKDKGGLGVLFQTGVLSSAPVDAGTFVKPGTPLAPAGTPVHGVQSLFERAQTIAGKRLPYLWGGGHGGKVNPATTGPLDCSGAVSAVLGINPRVSGQYMNWGSPGRGKSVTIYANNEHVLMEINGHFWGTSAANPGGGAGWIPRSQISAAYLKRFVARHPPGM